MQLEREECDSGQGYLYARPLDADAVLPFLVDRGHYREPVLENEGT